MITRWLELNHVNKKKKGLVIRWCLLRPMHNTHKLTTFFPWQSVCLPVEGHWVVRPFVFLHGLMTDTVVQVSLG